MNKRAASTVKEDISPNVVPMIDIMFLLMLFFMLSADMSQRELVSVQLPVADQIKETPEGTEPTTTVNVHRNGSADEVARAASRNEEGWEISVHGSRLTVEQLRTQLAIEAAEYTEDDPDPEAKRVLSSKKLLIRAERSAPYGLVQKVIETAGQVGMYKVEVAGARPTPPPR